MDLWVWLDGRVTSAADAKIGVLDHGFLYGDSIYETLRTHDGRLFRLAAHLQRLEASAAGIGLVLPWSRAELTEILGTMTARAPAGRDVGLRLIVTRGEGAIGLDPALCPHPRLIVLAWPIVRGDHPLAAGGAEIIVAKIRRNPPSALDPQIKSGNFLNNILAYREVVAVGAFEGILLTVEGAVAEGTTSNIFWASKGEVRTAEDRGILLGVTRSTVLEILAAERIPSRLGAFPPEDLRGADEVFLTSTLKGILPVKRVDDARFPVPGALTARIARAYRARIAQGGE